MFVTAECEEHGRLQILGAGGTAKVYQGSYKGEIVAVKLVYPPELTHEEVGAVGLHIYISSVM